MGTFGLASRLRRRGDDLAATAAARRARLLLSRVHQVLLLPLLQGCPSWGVKGSQPAVLRSRRAWDAARVLPDAAPSRPPRCLEGLSAAT